MAKPPRSEPLKPLSEPLIRPIGVRAPATMTVGSVDMRWPSESGSVGDCSMLVAAPVPATPACP